MPSAGRVSGFVPSAYLGWFFAQPQIVSFLEGTDQCSVEDLRELSRSLEF